MWLKGSTYEPNLFTSYVSVKEKVQHSPQGGLPWIFDGFVVPGGEELDHYTYWGGGGRGGIWTLTLISCYVSQWVDMGW